VTAVRRVHDGGEWSKLSRLGKLRCSIDTWEPAGEELTPVERRVWHRFLRGKKRRLATLFIRDGEYAEAASMARESLAHKVRSDRSLSDLIEYPFLAVCSAPFGAWVVGRLQQAVDAFRS
ncbi:MAG: hypothetical protein HKN17_09900, partial [Rhodothermales bacterium]|nr:hypothetical protein [Rhodothermales bacterium]